MSDNSSTSPRGRKPPPNKSGKSLAKGHHLAFHGRLAENWLRNHLASKYNVSAAKIDLSHKLSDWGLGDERSLAELAGEYNAQTQVQPALQGADIAPPKLIQGVKNGTLGTLASFLGNHAADNTAELRISAPPADILGWFLNYVRGKYGQTVQQTDTFGSRAIPFVDPNDYVGMERAFEQAFRRTEWPLIEKASGRTVEALASDVAADMG